MGCAKGCAGCGSRAAFRSGLLRARGAERFAARAARGGRFRLDWKGLTVQALGGFDSLEIVGNNDGTDLVAPQNTRMMFHRVQIRERAATGNLAFEAALVGGLDEAGDVQGRGVRKLFVSARSNVTLRWSRLRVYAGLDAEIAKFDADRFDLGVRNLAFVRDAEGPSRTGSRDPDMTPDELGEIGEDRVGVTAGAQLQATVDIVPQRVQLTAGARLDVYHAGLATLIGIDPRAQLSIKPLPWLEIRAAGGVYQQPPTFPILLPGIDTFALKLGLQRSVGGTVGEEVKLPLGFSLSTTGYYQQFSNLTDLPPLGARVCAPPPIPSLTGTTATLMRTTSGDAYGLEVLLRRATGRVSGWISYTLSRSERAYPCGLRPADYDQTHLLNVVVQARLPRGVVVGARLYVATGRPETLVDPNLSTEAPHTDVLVLRNNMRLPTFVQLDLRVDKEWRFRRWSLGLFVEVVNATFSRTVLYQSYPNTAQDVVGVSTYGPPSEVGFNWILPSIGLKGGF